ncbi:MAG: MarR family winged helix-turn-helix transcriptional regulator [Solirubrobacterales bacterium]
MSPSATSAAKAPTAQSAEPEANPTAAPDLLDHASGADGEAWALMMRLFSTEAQPRYLAITQEFGLHPSQAVVLQLLSEPRPMGALAEARRCDNSNITGIVDRLEERGFVERRADEHDRRVKLIALTAEGEHLRDELNRRLAEPPESLARLPAADRAALRDILMRAVAGT